MPPKPEEVRRRLRQLREDLRLSTAGLAEALSQRGVQNATNATVSRYEREGPLPRADYIAALAELADVTADWLLFGEGAKYTGTELSAADREMVATLAEAALEHPVRTADLLRAMLRILREDGGAPAT